MSSETWMHRFGVSERQLARWKQESKDEDDNMLHWCLRTGKIPESAYLAWATEALALPVVASAFFNQNPQAAFVKSMNGVYPWRVDFVPIMQWDGSLFIGCLELPAEPMNIAGGICHVLASPQDLERWFKKLVALGLEIPEPVAAKIPEPIAVPPVIAVPIAPIAEPPPPAKAVEAQPQAEVQLQPETAPSPAPSVAPIAATEVAASAPVAAASETGISEIEVPSQIINPNPSLISFNFGKIQSSATEPASATAAQPFAEIASAPAQEIAAPATDSHPDDLVMQATTGTQIPNDKLAAEPEAPVGMNFDFKAAAVENIAKVAPPSFTPEAPVDMNWSIPKGVAVALPNEVLRPRSGTPIVPQNVAAEPLDTATSVDELGTRACAHTLKVFEQALMLMYDGSGMRVWKWTELLLSVKGVSPPPIQVNDASIFRIVFRTRLPYHGYVCPSTVNTSFFNDFNRGQTPKHVTIVPIFVEDHLIGMLMGMVDHDVDYRQTLNKMEELGRGVSAQMYRILKGQTAGKAAA